MVKNLFEKFLQKFRRGTGNALFMKSLRDIRRSLSQFVCIFVMALISMAIVVGIDSIWKTMEVQAHLMYKATDLSDCWVEITNPSSREIWKVESTEGVELVEKRFNLDCNADFEGTPTLRVYGVEQDGQLDRPYSLKGQWRSGNGCILDSRFAKARGLELGDRLRIQINDRWMEFTVEELALSSEHVFAVKDSTTVMPSAKDYGFIVVSLDKIKAAFGGYAVTNELCLRLAEGTSVQTVSAALDEKLGNRLLGVMTHNDARSTRDVDVRVKQLQILARVFPIMFFLVTALITLSTMSRLVDDQRSQIGILKALGYSKKAILWHYTSYGVMVGTLGILGGLIIGPNVIGRILLAYLRTMYVLPSYSLSLNWVNVLIGSVVVMASTGGVTFLSSRRLMEEKPAALLREKPPKKGIHIFLERFPKYWEKQPFRVKLILRNALRNKSRMVMAILGVTGCAGLIVCAFTLRSMIKDITRVTYGEIYVYDVKCVLDDDASRQDIYNRHLDAKVQMIQETGMQAVSPAGVRKMVSVTIFDDGDSLMNMQRRDGTPIPLPDTGVILSRKMAESLKVTVGDTIALKRPDNSYVHAKVKDISYMVAGQGIYMGRSAWRDLRGNFAPTAALVAWNNAPDEDFLNSHYLEKSVTIEKQREDFESNLTIVDVAVMIMIIAGAVLCFVVLYNMGNLNFYERTRDLATLKVLGFNQKEIRSLVLVENVFSVIGGIIAGVPVGKLLSVIMASGFGEDLDLLPELSLINVAIAAVLTLIFAIFVNQVVARKMRHLDMLQALKSVE